MTMQIRRILVAIGALGHAPKIELHKAAALARKSNASIELFHAITEPDPGGSYPEAATAQALARRRKLTATRQQRRLQRMAADPAFKGLRVGCTASWDFPPHEAIVRRAQVTRADLVIAAFRRHRFGARLLLVNTDWELIRQCPVPVLLVKSRRAYKNPLILAAVDPFHAHARPTDLDGKLLQSGAYFAKLMRGKLHAFHAYMPLMSVESIPGAPPVILPPEAEAAHREVITNTVQELAAGAGVAARSCHVLMGGVSEELDAAVRRMGADLVVMGAVSRSALKRMFIGNAAERVLDRLNCDVLVIKPRGFKSKIVRHAAVVVAGPSAVPAKVVRHLVPRDARAAF